MYLIALKTFNQGTRKHRCRYDHHAIKRDKMKQNLQLMYSISYN